MADLSGKISDSDAISSTEHSEVGKDFVNEKGIARPADPSQNGSTRSNGRQVSEWEALQIAEAGDIDTIDREIGEVEADLQAMHIKSTWFKPQLILKDPKYFTWLLVGALLQSELSVL